MAQHVDSNTQCQAAKSGSTYINPDLVTPGFNPTTFMWVTLLGLPGLLLFLVLMKQQGI